LIRESNVDLVKAWTKTSFTESSFYKNTFDDNQKKTIEIIYHSEIIPAYHKMHDFLKDEYLKTAPKEIGISTVKEGKEYYEALTRYYSTYEITPQEVFDTGMSEVKRIKSEMNAIIKRLGFEGDFAQFLEFLRTDSQFYPTSAVHLLSRASIISKNIEGELPNYFGRLTPVPFTVKPVPAAIAPTYTAGRYSQGSFHNHKAGEYWVNTTKLKSRPFYTLPALTLHEAVPGHHLQIMLADELEGLPDFRKTYLSAFGEGWALYGEYLGKEMGIYRDDYEDFGRLTYEMWRACRLVVDPGMHYFGWSRDKAVDFMSSNTALSLHEVNTEIDRYIGWPGQAISYKLGEIKIRELRKKTENELGDKFDIRAFHDLILENGSIPLEALEIVVNAYIAEVNNPSAQTTSKFIHNVYFWMKEGVDLAQLEKDLIELGTINAIEFYSWGKPAKTAKRPIIEDSYDYAINAIFNSLVDYEAYKVHPTHVKFLEKYSQSFTKVTIFDNKIEPKK